MKAPRHAVYFTPPPGPLADFGAAWLGWDIASGTTRTRLDLPGVPRDAVTAKPRPYGFHATLKPPFTLAPGKSPAELARAVTTLAAGLAPVVAGPLHLARIGRFLALAPAGDQAPVNALAAAVLRGLDPFRAAPDNAGLARRRAAGLTPRQEALLTAWGYPYVLDEFRFHLTLTGPLAEKDAGAVEAALAPLVAPFAASPLRLDALTLARSDEKGRFRTVLRLPLCG